jgi:hypothetical protein
MDGIDLKTREQHRVESAVHMQLVVLPCNWQKPLTGLKALSKAAALGLISNIRVCFVLVAVSNRLGARSRVSGAHVSQLGDTQM